MEWLNQHTDENIGFFLIEIELWRINDSLPAPKFNIIEKPNAWAKTLKAAEGLSEVKKLQLEFWQSRLMSMLLQNPISKRISHKEKPLRSIGIPSASEVLSII